MIKKFSERLKKLRTDKELSQEKLAKGLGIYQQAIDRWERGVTEPDLETIIQIAYFFDVTTDYLLGLSNDISKYNEPKHKRKLPPLTPTEPKTYKAYAVGRSGMYQEITYTEEERQKEQEILKKLDEKKSRHNEKI